MPKINKLLEGLREGDLADLVLPLISVDEYVSKVGDPNECIVFGFYVHDEDAANDLNRFLQKSSVPLLDTQISVAPDQHGYYMVFVEFMNNARLPENVTSILAEIKSLVNIEEWDMRVRRTDGLIPYSQDNLKNCLEKLEQEDKTKDVLEFLGHSMLSNASIENNILILEGRERHTFKIKKFDRIENILENAGLNEIPLSFDMKMIAKMNRIKRSLGENWDAISFGKSILIHKNNDPRGILVQF